MKKEVIAVCSILVIIFTTNYICQVYLNNVADDISENLKELHSICMEYLEKQDNEEKEKIIEEKIKEISNKWEKSEQILSLYIEHSELEKIDVNIVRIKSFQEIDEYDEATQAVSECIFMFKHIRQKQRMSLSNLF